MTEHKTEYNWRNTQQDLLHSDEVLSNDDIYRIYPVHAVNTIDVGFDAFAHQISQHKNVVIDGYVGVFWEDLQKRLAKSLDNLSLKIRWINIADYMLPESEIDRLVASYLGGDDPIFGTRTDLSLIDLFDTDQLQAIQADPHAGITIAYGCGAALLKWDKPYLVYVDLPKNEIQYRSRAKTIANLGQKTPQNAKSTYKRFYFVDWIVLNQHKQELTPHIDLIVDGQDPHKPTMMSGEQFRAMLDKLSETVFRVRPWFEPGVWGGQWLREHIPNLAQNVPNYAWSFEMIAPEQGIIFSDGNHLLEVSFDFLMYNNVTAILGKYAQYFGYEFPIRFDFLDTIQGGNLSVQCHPRPEFMRENFGEHFTQDETYYILECDENSEVYLGFQENIQAQNFRQVLEDSHQHNRQVNISDFVQVFPSKKHDLFLIPNGTIHASGSGNLVLEISATPYIFTFKMYDWLRLDLDGNPRPINIERAFENLYFERKGNIVSEELISKPIVKFESEAYRVVHLPTHESHFYDIERYEIISVAEVSTEDSVQVLMVVEGASIIVEINEHQQKYNYAETFVIPAKAKAYKLINTTGKEVQVIRAFMKASWFEEAENQWLSLR